MPTSREQRHTEHLPQAKQVERKGFATTMREKLAMAGTWFEQLRSGGNAIKNSELMQQAAFRTVQDRLNHLNAEVAAQASAHNVRPKKYLTEAEAERQRLQALLGKAEKNYQKVEAEVEAEHIRLIEQKIEELHTAIAKAASTPGITQEKYLQETQEDQDRLLDLLHEANTYYAALKNKVDAKRAELTQRHLNTTENQSENLDNLTRIASGIEGKRSNFFYIQKDLTSLAEQFAPKETDVAPEASLLSPEISKIKEQLNTRLANLTEQIVTLSKSRKPEEKSAAQKLETEAVILGAAISAMEQGNNGPALNYLQQYPATPPAETPRENALSEIFSSVPLEEPARLNNKDGSKNILSSTPLTGRNERVSQLASQESATIKNLSNKDLIQKNKEAQDALINRLLSLNKVLEKGSVPEINSYQLTAELENIRDLSASATDLKKLFQMATFLRDGSDQPLEPAKIESLNNILSATKAAIEAKEAATALDNAYEKRKNDRAATRQKKGTPPSRAAL